MPNAVSIKNLVKTYAGSKKSPPKEALKGISLDIPEGSFFGLLGPNGAGKSTLINIMAGLVMKSGGTVEINGYDIDSHRRQASFSLGVVPQELVVDTFFTARQAMDIHAGYYGVPKEQRRTQELIDAIGLTQQADMSSRRLSGGMKRRLLVGKSLVHNPKVLILDEPTAGVDVELREQLWDYVKQLNKQGTTILLTTHYLEEAQELCDQIAIINHGAVVAMDSKEKLVKRMDRKELTVTFSKPIKAADKSLAQYNPVIDAHGRLTLTYQPTQTHMGEILAAIHKTGADITDLSTIDPTVEDIFRQLTTKKSA
jgi:ABC-2 type transport system ATP-binding protein